MIAGELHPDKNEVVVKPAVEMGNSPVWPMLTVVLQPLLCPTANGAAAMRVKTPNKKLRMVRMISKDVIREGELRRRARKAW